MTPERMAELRDFARKGNDCTPWETVDLLDEIERLLADYDRELSKSAALTRVMREVAEDLDRWANHDGHMPKRQILEALSDQLTDARAATYGKAETKRRIVRNAAGEPLTCEHCGESLLMVPHDDCGKAEEPHSPGCKCTWCRCQAERSTEVKQPGRCNATSSEGKPCTLQAGHARYHEHCPEGGTEWRNAWWDDSGGKPHRPEPGKQLCVWCGHTGALDADAMIEHVQTCTESPLAEANETFAHLTRERDELQKECSELKAMHRTYAMGAMNDAEEIDRQHRQAEQLRAALKEVGEIALRWHRQLGNYRIGDHEYHANRQRVDHLLEVCGVK